MVIQNVKTAFEIEPLVHPFGFKGGALTSLWQYAVFLETDTGLSATGVGNQNTLWADASLFAAHSPGASSAMMYLITEYAAQQLRGLEMTTPQQMLDKIFPEVVRYAKQATGRDDLRTTFVLNALVGVDHALWKLYEQAHGHQGLDRLIPPEARAALGHRYGKISLIPLVSFGVALAEVRQLVEDGFFLLKIKIGSDPEKDGDLDKMLAWDKRRLLEVHNAVKDAATPYTDSGHIAYYLDANGRYDSIERLRELLDYADEIGVLERTVIVEEPFPEEHRCDVSSLPALIAADESAHSPEDVAERIALGYRAIALKPIAKTMSVTMRMLEVAYAHNIPCFCADLTVGPLLLEINKSIAARLPCLPGLKLPVVEGNGWQNYSRWAEMQQYNPANDRNWTVMKNGLYELDESFYRMSGGMFMESPHYRELVDEYSQ